MTDVYDIAIIGAGPAGLSAALTGRIRSKKVALFEHGEFSRKLRRAHEVDNYLGLPHRTGREMMDEMARHALDESVDVIRDKVVTIFGGRTFTIACKEGIYKAHSVIITTGVTSARLLDGEKELLGRGVSYCATCDGMFYRDKSVAVVAYNEEGEGDAAYLANLCREVHYLPQYRTDGKLRADTIIVHEGEVPRRIEGEGVAERLVTTRGVLDVDGVFILRESDPADSLIRSLATEGAHIVVDRQMRTNIGGLFAAGDVTGRPYQVAKAVGEGQVAALSAVAYLHEREQEVES